MDVLLKKAIIESGISNDKFLDKEYSEMTKSELFELGLVLGRIETVESELGFNDKYKTFDLVREEIQILLGLNERAKSLDWWNSKSDEYKDAKCCEYYTGRNFETLTGNEIEKMYKKDIIRFGR